MSRLGTVTKFLHCDGRIFDKKININKLFYFKSTLWGFISFFFMLFITIIVYLTNNSGHDVEMENKNTQNIYDLLFSGLILAPLLETFMLYFIYKILFKIKSFFPIYYILICMILFGFLHKYFITGFVLFFFFALQYAYCIRRVPRSTAFWGVALAHMTNNALAIFLSRLPD